MILLKITHVSYLIIYLSKIQDKTSFIEVVYIYYNLAYMADVNLGGFLHKMVYVDIEAILKNMLSKIIKKIIKNLRIW